MGKRTKEEYAAVKQQKNELLKLLLERTGVTRSKIHELAEHDFVRANLDMVTNSERQRFDRLVFGV